MRGLDTIAREIFKEWPNVHYTATPYLQAMSSLSGIDSVYGLDDARSIVAYFLSNAGSWRGEAARRIKAELRGMLAAKR